MKGEWPVLLKILGKGEGDERYLSVAEVRTLFVERRFPDGSWRGCRRRRSAKASSSEVDTGSRKENASKQDLELRF